MSVDKAEWITSAPRAAQDGRDSIRTYSGLYVRPLALRAEDLRLKDIAHHLSNICRYTGACPGFYSVAQHSVMVVKYLIRKYRIDRGHWRGHKILQLALLHDAPEAYLNDIASPVKHTEQFRFYRELDDKASRLCAKTFIGTSDAGFDDDWPLIKEADDETFYRERRVFWGKRQRGDFFIRLPACLAKLEFKYWAWRLGLK